jgi:hypothetical protein
LANDLLDLSDFFLNFPRRLLVLTFGLQVRIIGRVANLLFDCALNSCAVPLIASFVLSLAVVLLAKVTGIPVAQPAK